MFFYEFFFEGNFGLFTFLKKCKMEICPFGGDSRQSFEEWSCLLDGKFQGLKQA